MKKFTSVLLCVVLVLSLCCVTAGAAEASCIEARAAVVDDGSVAVVVSAKQAAANARLNVTFDSNYLTYVGYETDFAVHSAKAEGEQITVGLANASSAAVAAGETLVTLRFEMTGHWDETQLTVTAERYNGNSVNESVTVEAVGGGYRFEDVTADQWFFEAVDYMASEGYIVGISESHFGPALNMNRASFVTLLGRLEGVEKTFAQTCFTDVPVDSFYSGYVAWAVENGITTGISETKFAPAAAINRAQMVTFLYRYAEYKGMDVAVDDPQEILKDYTDGETVGAIDWAAKPFAWAVQRGIINGMDGALNPSGTANRAQVAVMLYRFFFEQ